MSPTKTASQIEEQLEQLRSQLEAQHASPQTASPAIVQALESAIARLEAQLPAAPQPEPATTESESSDSPQASRRAPHLLSCNGQHKAVALVCGYLTVEEEGVRLQLADGTAIACRVFGQGRKAGLERIEAEQLYYCTLYPRMREGRVAEGQLHRWVAREQPKEEKWHLTGVFSLKEGYPASVLVQRDAEYAKLVGWKGKLSVYGHQIVGLDDCELKPGRCYEFPIERKGDRILLTGDPKRISAPKPVKPPAGEEAASPEEEQESAA